ncbi:hypothetical protein [Parafrankia sp. EUN1f]|uniref:hypothetical protein n=1 Tax=Parafrankia sp. EUN1f TaxID=102897 RepID=UPI0001C459AB|nr:hypothetical protein [Parafrankia sp. EUN1f]EFC86498.1 hypothetical protein FrEUN1fDRAFT_0393 [Parafrankia sp. EUN1f]
MPRIIDNETITVEFTRDELRFLLRLTSKAYGRDWLSRADDATAIRIVDELDPLGRLTGGIDLHAADLG